MKKVTIKSDTRVLLDSSIKELTFYKLQVEFLLNGLEELKPLVGELENKVIKNTIERHNLDKLIHAKLLFK